MAERYRTQKKRRILRELNLTKIAAVDQPCNEHAQMTIMKRDDSAGDDPLLEKKDLNLSGTDAGDKTGSNTGEEPMTAAEKKQIEDLEKQVTDLTTKLTKVTEDSGDAKKMAELQDELTAATAKAEEAAAKVEKAEADAAEAAKAAAAELVKASMSDVEKDYFATLDKAGKDKFMDMDEEDRKKESKKSLDNDEVLEVAGRSIRKSIVGDDQFAVIKHQQEESVQLNKALTEERDRRVTVELTKKAETDLSHMPGTTEEKVAALKVLGDMDAEARKALETMLAAGDKAVSAAFKTIGHGDGSKGDPDAAAFSKRISEVKKRDECTQNEALAKAREEFPEEFKAYQNVSN